jgi:hypothetical protein
MIMSTSRLKCRGFHLAVASGDSVRSSRPARKGFSLLEVILSLGMSMALAAMTTPALYKAAESYKVAGAARGLASQLALAKMRAAAEFSQSQLNANVSAGSFTVQVYSKTSASFVTEGGTQYLVPGVVFAYPSGAPPAGSQTPIGQTTPLLFNSRGMHIDGTGAPTGDDALYLGDVTSQYYYAVTISASGKVAIYSYNPKSNGWVLRD